MTIKKNELKGLKELAQIMRDCSEQVKTCADMICVYSDVYMTYQVLKSIQAHPHRTRLLTWQIAACITDFLRKNRQFEPKKEGFDKDVDKAILKNWRNTLKRWYKNNVEDDR